MLVEICASSIQSALNAQEAGASRIELCSELGVGGITPSHGMLVRVREKLTIPIHVLIRTRSGNFLYSDEEFETMLADIEFCKQIGCDGIVSGVLLPDFRIDLNRTKELIEKSKPMNFTFHRAFDWVPNPKEALQELKEIQVNRILTSGQEISAEKGIDCLVDLKELAGKDLTIMPGGGINPDNVQLFQEKGFEEIHASASGIYSESELPKISMNSAKFLDESKVYVSDLHLIRTLLNKIH